MSLDEGERREQPSAVVEGRTGIRLGEESAAKILERAAALDAERNAEIGEDQLREAAAGAGISREAFEQAMREHSEKTEDGAGGSRPGAGRPVRTAERGVAPAQLAYFSSVLRDLLGDEGQIVVVGDHIEWRDDDGLTVSLDPAARNAAATVTVEGRFRTILLGIVLPLLIPAMIFLLGAMQEEEWAILLMGLVIGLVLSLLGAWFATRRERRKLHKQAERIRRQLERLLGPGSPAG